ncbi:MAG: hypothetical protein AAFQ06_05165 [Pseudomonadota bacterium]
MGDRVTMAAFSGVADVEGSLSACEAVLLEMGLVAEGYDPSAVLSPRHGRVRRPGHAAAKATAYGDRLLELRTDGVSFEGPGYFNARALGFSDWFDCPSCDGRVDQSHPSFTDQISHLGFAAVDWVEGDRDATALCVMCDAATSVPDWRLEDPVFLADMAVAFWNWPFLARDAGALTEWWHVDVVAALEGAVGRPAALSGYKI